MARAIRFSERRWTELIDQDAHRHAGRAGVAIGHVGDVLASPEPALEQIVDEEARLVAGEVGEQLPFEPAGQIGAGLRRRDVEFRKVALVLCHVSPTGSESEPVCRKLSGSEPIRAIGTSCEMRIRQPAASLRIIRR